MHQNSQISRQDCARRAGAHEKVILWALPAGQNDRLHEQPLTSFPLTAAQADKVQAVAARDGWHGFRRVVENGAPPDFKAALNL